MINFNKAGAILAGAVFALAIAIFSALPTYAVGYGGGGGGGGGSPLDCHSLPTPPPGGFRVDVDDSPTAPSTVNLKMYGGGAWGMAISNTNDFAGKREEGYQQFVNGWKLPDDQDGSKTIYFRFYNHCGFPTPIYSGVFNHRSKSVILKPVVPQPPAGGRVLGEKITAVDDLIATLKYGMRSDDVKTLQDALKAAGFFPKSVASTGYYGPITRRAVNAYLASKSKGAVSSLSADASIDELIAALKYNDRGVAVASLQTKLRNLGFFPSWVRSTGWFGPITQGAVNKYKASTQAK
ncbi:MAG: peptidoglycan-binding protein [Patescibacteria group bacterium]